MKKFKLLAFLSLLAIPLTSVSVFKSAQVNDSLSANLLNAKAGNPTNEDYFKIDGKGTYSTLLDAIDAAEDGDTIIVLQNYEESHERQTKTNLPLVGINDKSITINGVGEDGRSHSIKGVRFFIGSDRSKDRKTVTFKDVIIDADKFLSGRYSADCNPLFSIKNSTVNFTGNTVIKNYKFISECVFSLTSDALGSGIGTIINISDNTEITNCAAKAGLFKYYNTNCAINMSGGTIHNNYSTKTEGEDFEGLIVNMAHGSTAEASSKFYMTGGSIYDNNAAWSSDYDPRSKGTIYIDSGFVDVKIINGQIYGNKTTGGAVYVNDIAKGNVYLGGETYIDDNEMFDGYDYYPSNILLHSSELENDETIQISISNDDHLTGDSSIGILSDKQLGQGVSTTIVRNANQTDFSYFKTDDSYDYKLIHNISGKTIDLYRYSETEPRFTHPVAYEKDYFRYSGKNFPLLRTPGNVIRGGQMLYSINNSDKSKTDLWTPYAPEVTATNVGDYYISYYVTANAKSGTEESPIYTLYTNILPQIVKENPFRVDGSLEYNGEPQAPKLSCKLKPTPVEGTDYDIIYHDDHTDAGEHFFDIKMKGNFEGEFKDMSFTIEPKHIKNSDITWPEDNFVYNGLVQNIEPTFKDVKGKAVKLYCFTRIEGGRVDFKEPSEFNKPYEAIAYYQDRNGNYIRTPEEALKDVHYYNMRVSSEDVKKDIELNPETGKPIVKVESDFAFDAWKTIKAYSVNEESKKQEYVEATEALVKNNVLNDADIVSAIYEIKIVGQDSKEYAPGGLLDIYLELPNGVTENNNFDIYHIHTKQDGSKEVTALDYIITKDNYALVETDELSSFVFVRHQINLSWLIITLSVTGGTLLVATVAILAIRKKNKKKAVRSKR